MRKILLAAAILISVQGLAQSFTPMVKLTAGKKYKVTTSSKANMVQEAMGQTMEIPMEISGISELLVKAPASTGYSLSSTNTRLALSISMMGQDMNYDSDKKEDREGEMGQSLNGMINQTVTFDINSFGKVIEPSVVKPAAANTEAADAANPLLKMLGIGTILSGTSAAVNIFATDAAMLPGQSFTDTSGTDAAEKVSSTYMYTLTGIKDGIANFSISGKTSMVKEMDMQGMQATINTSTAISGEMQVDVNTGLLIKKTVNMAVKGNTEIAGMQIPQSGNTVVTVIVEEIK
ncbi:MAG: DUF6263 family protein [Ferruginibacter sp.]